MQLPSVFHSIPPSSFVDQDLVAARALPGQHLQEEQGYMVNCLTITSDGNLFDQGPGYDVEPNNSTVVKAGDSFGKFAWHCLFSVAVAYLKTHYEVIFG